MNDKIKKHLFSVIKDAIQENNMSQRDLAKALQVSQPRVSNLIDERKDLFSIDKLLEFVQMLGYDVSIEATKKEEAL